MQMELGTGSPTSVVAAPVGCESENGRVEITVAFAKLSLLPGVPTVKLCPPLRPPPGPGSKTFTRIEAVFVSNGAGTFTVSEVALQVLVLSTVLPNSTIEFDGKPLHTKFVPVKVMMNDDEPVAT